MSRIALFLLSAFFLALVPLPAQSGREESFALQPSIDFLLRAQGKDGSWIADPRYLEPPSPTRVYIAPPERIFTDDTLAVTALCCRALKHHPGRDPEAGRRALARGVAHILAVMEREKKRYAGPECSPIWQAYALDLFCDLAGAGEGERWRRAARRVVRCLAAGECEGGGWTYAYYDSSRGRPRSFCTALVVRSLLTAREAGLELPAGLVRRGTALLLRARLEGGGCRYLYHHRDLPLRVTAMGSIGRLTLVEATLLRAGRGKGKLLREAADLFLRHRRLLDRAITKQTRYTNEGCHHYFAYYHFAEAATRLAGPVRDRCRRAIITHLRESRRPDGSWWDSRRAGPAAATAMALLALRALEAQAPPPEGSPGQRRSTRSIAVEEGG